MKENSLLSHHFVLSFSHIPDRFRDTCDYSSHSSSSSSAEHGVLGTTIDGRSIEAFPGAIIALFALFVRYLVGPWEEVVVFLPALAQRLGIHTADGPFDHFGESCSGSHTMRL
jgi:hypothetical protein